MNCSFCNEKWDQGPYPHVMNMDIMSIQNNNFRTAVWTGANLQMTLMCIPPGGAIGEEMHADTDQYIRIEQGKAMVKMGRCRQQTDFKKSICKGDGVFIPAGTWHNVFNTGRMPLKVSSIYAPPNHPRGTVERIGNCSRQPDAG